MPLIEGNADANNLAGTDGRDTILGYAEDDTLRGRDRADSLEGGTGDDTIYGGTDNDVIHGDSAIEDPGSPDPADGSDDWLYGDAGRDTVYGGRGNDRIFVAGRAVTDSHFGGDGADTVTAIAGTTFERLLLDTLAGVEFLDMDLSDVQGTAEDDLFDLTGLQGYVGQGAFLLLEGNDTFRGSDSAETVSGSVGNDLLEGNGGDDSLTGNRGRDTLYGGGGNDILVTQGGEGGEVLAGGEGLDTLVALRLSVFEDLILDAAAGIEILDMGGFAIQGSVDSDLFDLTGVQDYVGGEAFLLLGGNDVFRGTDTGDTVFGAGGNDLLAGNGGNDELNGGLGRDTLDGGAGDDRLVTQGGGTGEILVGGEGNDTLVVQAQSVFEELLLDAAAGIEVLDMGGARLVGTIEGDVFDLTGVQRYVSQAGVQMRAGNDVFRGSERAETVFGADGNDTIQGNGGNDVLNGERADDSMSGGEGLDRLLGGGGSDILAGDGGDDSLAGDVGNDRLTGGDGRDRLYGGDDDDRLDGGAESDVLDAGLGADVLVFGAGGGNDTVFRWENDIDTLHLDDGLWTGVLTAAEIVEQFAVSTRGGVVFRFADGTSFRLAGVQDAGSLIDDITVF